MFGISLHWGICENDAERKEGSSSNGAHYSLPWLPPFGGIPRKSLSDVSPLPPTPHSANVQHWSACFNTLMSASDFQWSHSCHMRTCTCVGTWYCHFLWARSKIIWCTAESGNNWCSRTCTAQQRLSREMFLHAVTAVYFQGLSSHKAVIWNSWGAAVYGNTLYQVCWMRLDFFFFCHRTLNELSQTADCVFALQYCSSALSHSEQMCCKATWNIHQEYWLTKRTVNAQTHT